jgi:hypothetical protein
MTNDCPAPYSFVISTLVKPSWLSSSVEHKVTRLLDLCASVLKDVCHNLSLSVSHKEHNKQGPCLVLLHINAFESHCIKLIGKIISELKHLLSSSDLIFDEHYSDFYILLALCL